MISPAQRRIGTKGAANTNMRFPRVTGVLGVSLAMTAALLYGASATPVPESSGRSTVVVNVTGFRNVKGKVDALIFVTPDGFPEDDSKAFDKDEVSIDPDTMSAQIVFKGVPRGLAAVTVLHDENMNRKIDKNFFGIPQEGYGTSNNPRKAWHSPKWDEATFPVDAAEVTIPIKLIYW
jgi:uncharacterized protein (DUF2141 family)